MILKQIKKKDSAPENWLGYRRLETLETEIKKHEEENKKREEPLDEKEKRILLQHLDTLLIIFFFFFERFPPTIPKLKSNIINCLSSHEGYLSTIDITSINPDSKQNGNPGNPRKKYQIKIPANHRYGIWTFTFQGVHRNHGSFLVVATVDMVQQRVTDLLRIIIFTAIRTTIVIVVVRVC